eukprot:353313-Chlamydomonas_euryale.AAC.12
MHVGTPILTAGRAPACAQTCTRECFVPPTQRALRDEILKRCVCVPVCCPYSVKERGVKEYLAHSACKAHSVLTQLTPCADPVGTPVSQCRVARG